MAIGDYIKNKQPLLYRTFCNALRSNKVSHAYFLSGEAGTPLKETAIFLAKSILCDHPDPLADETCTTCARIEKGEYPDFILYDGEENSIKKEAITNLTASFSLTPLEAKGKKVYVINHVENMRMDTSNTLLKFLEEPPGDTYAILTSQNEERILPTILSRCERLRLLLAPRKEVIEEAIALGVSEEDAQILSHFINDSSLLQTQVGQEEYTTIKDAVIDFLDALSQTKRLARFTMEKDVIPLVKGKPALRLYFDMLVEFLKETLAYQRGESIFLSAYVTILEALGKKLPHLEESIIETMTMRSQIESNINPGLLLTHLAMVLCKE